MIPVRWVFVLSLLAAAASLLGGCRTLQGSAAGGVVPAALVEPAVPTATAVTTDTVAAEASAAPNQSVAANKLAAAQLATAWNVQDYAGIGALLDTSATINNPGLPDLHDGESYVERAKTVHAVIPNYQLTYDDIVAEGDRVLTRETFKGKLGNTSFTYTGMLLLQLKDGKIVDVYEVSDELAVRKFLGDIPNDQKNANFGWQGGADKPSADSGAGDPEKNKQIVQQWWEGDAAAQGTLAAPDFAYHNPWSPEARTLADRTRIMGEIVAAFPDLTYEIEGPIIAENDKAGFRFNLAGTGLELPGIALYRIANGEVAEEWIVWANTTLFSALNSN